MATKSDSERRAFSPGEFAKLFGKSQTWGYRQIYAGKIKAITEFGRILIPAAEVEFVLKTAGIYGGLKPKAVKTTIEIQALVSQLPNVWKSFLAARRQAKQPKTSVRRDSALRKLPSSPCGRQAALARMVGPK